ncbi:MAG: enoyl-CoA hydratase-related protein [Burkholderiales bacterium]
MGNERQGPFIHASTRDGLLTLRLDRPPVNVLHAESMRELQAALAVAQDDAAVRAVLLTGAGERAFCAGVSVADHGPARGAETVNAFRDLLIALRAFPLPLVAALNGATLGGGNELALACDMMVARPGVKIGQPEIKLATLPTPAMLLMQGRLPANLIAEMVLGGEPILAEDAQRLGLVNAVLDGPDFDAACVHYMQRFTRMSRPVLVLAKQGLRQAHGDLFEREIDALKQRVRRPLAALEDFQEGLAAFAEKRPPQWRHR